MPRRRLTPLACRATGSARSSASRGPAGAVRGPPRRGRGGEPSRCATRRSWRNPSARPRAGRADGARHDPDRPMAHAPDGNPRARTPSRADASQQANEPARRASRRLQGPRHRATPGREHLDAVRVGRAELRAWPASLGAHIRRYRDWRIANAPKATNPSAAAVSRNLPNGWATIVCMAPSSPCFWRSAVSVA